MTIKIMKNNLGYNGACANCEKIQNGSADQPLIIYWKSDNSKRGHREPICCEECAKAYADQLKKIMG